MKPRMEKTTNPATKLVALLRKQRATESLWEEIDADKDGEQERKNPVREERRIKRKEEADERWERECREGPGQCPRKRKGKEEKKWGRKKFSLAKKP